jgi:hypothetical protein
MTEGTEPGQGRLSVPSVMSVKKKEGPYADGPPRNPCKIPGPDHERLYHELCRGWEWKTIRHTGPVPGEENIWQDGEETMNPQTAAARSAHRAADTKWKQHKRDCPECARASHKHKPSESCRPGQALLSGQKATLAELWRQRVTCAADQLSAVHVSASELQDQGNGRGTQMTEQEER